MTDTNIFYSFHFLLRVFPSLCYCAVHVYIVNEKNCELIGWEYVQDIHCFSLSHNYIELQIQLSRG